MPHFSSASRSHASTHPRPVFVIHQDRTANSTSARPSSTSQLPSAPVADSPDEADPRSPPRTTLTSASPSVMNSRSPANGAAMTVRDTKQKHKSYAPGDASSSSTLAPNGNHDIPRRLASIRPVSSFDNGPPTSSADYSSDVSPSLTNGTPASVLSSSPKSNTSTASPTLEKRTRDLQQHGSDKTLGGRLRPKRSGQLMDAPVFEAHSRSKSPSANGRSAISSARLVDIPQRDSSIGGTERPPPTIKTSTDGAPEDSATTGDAPQGGVGGGGGWDSTVGKAGLGKTGRVINKLVSDNESLKRDIKIEKLKSEESRQAAKLLEDKMERMIADYESRLLESNVTKTLLARKERQVESLQAAVDLERQRTSDAQGKERTWREEMERMRADTKRTVDEATTKAALMEGRYNAISSHWRDQGEEVRRALAKMGREVTDLLAERRRDDEKITTLRDLCDQQDGNIRELRQQKEDLAARFEAYKDEQEGALRGIKGSAAAREAEQQRMLDEAREVLDKLRWALNIKKEIDWAE